MDRRLILVAAVATVSVVGAIAGGAWLASAPSPARVQASIDISSDMASTLLEQKLEQAPDDLAGWKMLGRSYLAQGRYMEAVGAYSRAAQIDARDPEVAGALKQLETIARDRGRHDETMKTR
jgi:cytochrome c-type biogenesis protein CcmH